MMSLARRTDGRKLWLIRFVHTVIWVVLASAVVVLPLAAHVRRFDLVAGLTVLVLIECAALAANRGECPLRNIAAEFTDSRKDGFDIFIPGWLARNTKLVFGSLFVAGEVFALVQWFFAN
jgi:hypothetical protein